MCHPYLRSVNSNRKSYKTEIRQSETVISGLLGKETFFKSIKAKLDRKWGCCLWIRLLGKYQEDRNTKQCEKLEGEVGRRMKNMNMLETMDTEWFL